jgi:ankyrin repeat protein
MAAKSVHLAVVKWLVNELGADINKDTFGTPFMAASARQRHEVVRWLLKHGAHAQTKYEHLGTAADVSRNFGAPA